MTKKTLGYVELEWTCPNCNTNNPGFQKTCKSCGSPQPENVQFHAAEKQELLKDEQKIAQAQKGADFHCPYCNTRNPADATVCSQCGGDLTGAAQRASGMAVGATLNPAAGNAVPAAQPPQPAKKPISRIWWILLPVASVLLMACCVLVGYLVFHTESVSGSVQSVSWQRTIVIEELHDVVLEDWKDNVPSGVQTLSCEQKERSTEKRVVGSKQVCEQKMVDKGNGAGEMVEECHDEDQYEEYPVYDNYCKYPAQKWEQIDQLLAKGNDLNPHWPPVQQLDANQREGERKETYTVLFETSKGVKKYTTDDATLFGQCQIGSTWTLDVNTFGTVTDIKH
jgi:predicted nucleic acid-binding Zn ribbon protein